MIAKNGAKNIFCLNKFENGNLIQTFYSRKPSSIYKHLESDLTNYVTLSAFWVLRCLFYSKYSAKDWVFSSSSQK